jgi:hypothetical protein
MISGGVTLGIMRVNPFSFKKLGALILLSACCCAGHVQGAVVELIGSGLSWPSSWQTVSGLNDANDGVALSRLDFVGDSNDPGFYWADSGGYLCFRMRVATATVLSNTYSDTLMVLIDQNNDKIPDYGFGWDSKSGNNASHGLEMLKYSTGSGGNWGAISMDDIDGSSGQKEVSDINGNSRTTDGYVRSTDSIATTSLGTTTFIDFAVSKSYLGTYVSGLSLGAWNIAAVSIANATDHNAFNADIAGGAGLTSSSSLTGWATIPEPSVGCLVASAFGLFLTRKVLGRRAS